MKKFITIGLLSISTATTIFAQKLDTVDIGSTSLKLADLNLGKRTYIVYNKKSKEGFVEKPLIVKIETSTANQNGKKIISIVQSWEADTIVHTSSTQLSQTDFSTLKHQFYWKRLGYSSTYDFEKKTVSFEGIVPDSTKAKVIDEFNESFNKYHLNWHSDLIIFPLLPLDEYKVFRINFYDPGFGAATTVFYTVLGAEMLSVSKKEKIDCWILEHKLVGGANGYQRFWISKKTKEVIREEDFFNGRYRFKIKLSVAE
jgi:hypothetical protein